MKIKVANTLDDFMKVMVLRGIVFIGEQHHKYQMEFDEHELSGRTHLLAFDDNEEPIGSMRIWKEGKEAKFERLAVVKEYRGSGVAEEIVKAGMVFCKNQGVETVCLYCIPQLQRYWNKQNFERVGGNKILKYRGLDLVPVAKKICGNGEVLTEKEKEEIPQIMQQQKGEWCEAPTSSVALVYCRKPYQR